MTSDLEALGRRAIACPYWRWMPGMLVVWPTYTERITDADSAAEWLPSGDVPDLTDPATVGCLHHLVREAWGDVCPAQLGYWLGGGTVPWAWQVDPDDRGGPYVWGVDALVVALEAAPFKHWPLSI